MMKIEGVNTALSVILSHFAPLQRVLCYEKACNIAKFIVLSVLWVNDNCLIVCDTLHNKEHTSSSYASCNEHGTFTAKSISNLWNVLKTQLSI